MEISRQLKNQHLLWRAGFGITTRDLPNLDNAAPHKLLKQLFKESSEPAKLLAAASDIVRRGVEKSVGETMMQLSDEEKKKYRTEQRRLINKQSNKDIQQLTKLWMREMVAGQRLREKMSLFWHGHFACRVNNSLYQEQLLDVIRTNALGNFGDLLRGVSKSASMLAFLNNQQNRKQHPNENFAREVMELFTLGRGNYTENDVKEAARAFTGWQYQPDGSFAFKPKIHDADSKTLLGHTGNFDGDQVLDIILKQPQTALFITTKLYRYFVNEQVDKERAKGLADNFYKSNYDISALMQEIFSADWFYDEQNIGAHIKSPVELLAGIQSFLPISVKNEDVFIVLQRLLGQWLFNPPNVAGWPGGTAWIDSSSLMLRLRIPNLIKEEAPIDLKPKQNDDIQMGKKEMLDVGKGNKPQKTGKGYQILATIDWAAYTKALKKDKDIPETFEGMKKLLLQTTDAYVTEESMGPLLKDTQPEKYLENLTIALMATPEYQLC
ncbi:MAG: DUF1800 domain-containing protein [Edaphocola sp.]